MTVCTESTVSFGNPMDLYVQIMAEIISNDGYRSDEAAIVEDKGSIDYRSVAAKMKAQDDSKFYTLLYPLIMQAIICSSLNSTLTMF